MFRSETSFARLLAAVAMIALCAGCDNPARYRANLPLDHDAAAPHTIEDIWHESGAYETLGPHPKVAFAKRAVSNIVLGTVTLDYDPHVGKPLPASHLSIRTNGANAVPSRAADGEFF
ncbi:MAG: hypothetical protein HZB26_04305, partial [Candidatus Hydrogenedentes bacterium]|nr:hypothetical protein [Candidatus Hydrogenedentota bacterium]